MALLVDLIRQIGMVPSSGGVAPAEPFFEKGELATVDGQSNMTVRVGGTLVSARTVTDEPLEAGAMVWVSKTNDQWIVHGSVK